MRKRKGKIYEGQYFITVVLCAVCPLICALICAFLPDNTIKDFFSIACIPLFTAFLIHGMGRMQSSSHAFLDLRILENNCCLDDNQVVWYTEGTISDNAVIEIYNNGECTISTTDIVINPTTPKKDKIYTTLYPVKPGDSLFAAIPFMLGDVNKIYLQYYSNGVDKSLSFEGNLTIQGKNIFKGKKFIFESISPIKNYSMAKIKKQIVMKRQIVSELK